MPSRSPFMATRQSGGVGPWYIVDSRFVPGDVYYISSTSANKSDTAAAGQTPDQPFATLAFAVANKGTANQGDVFILLPGHQETISSNTALTFAVAGITVLGLGTGNKRPTITIDTANTATLNVAADNIVIDNVVFTANFLSIAAAF